MKIGKYAFKDKATADSKIKSLPKKHSHSIVKLGKIVKSNKFHIDVLWEGLDDHPYGWKSSAVGVADGNGVHSFYGIDYQTNKI